MPASVRSGRYARWQTSTRQGKEPFRPAELSKPGPATSDGCYFVTTRKGSQEPLRKSTSSCTKKVNALQILPVKRLKDWMTRGAQPVRPWLENKVQTELNLPRVCLPEGGGRSALPDSRAGVRGSQI